MSRKGGRPPISARNIVGTDGLASQPGHYLGAHALHRLGIEARLGKGEAEVVKCFVAVFLERAQCAAQMIAPREKAEFDGAAFEPIMEFHGVEGAGALIEQAGHHVRNARLVHGILVRASENGEFERDQGGGTAHQPSFDSAGADHAFDRYSARGWRHQNQHCTGEKRREYAWATTAKGESRIHERFSSERASLTR